jgi:hypothetical protein
LLFGELFESPGQAVAGVVDDNIYALEFVNCGFECGVDVCFLRNIEFYSEVVLRFIREWFAQERCWTLTLSVVFLNERFSGFRAVATAISPLSRTSWTR